MVGAPKGGTGKSTMALTLAVTLGLRLRLPGRTVALVDANIQQSDSGLYLGGSHTPTVMELVRDQSLITPESVNQGLQHRHDLNLSVLLGPNSSVDANPAYLNSDLYNRVLDAMKFNYDYIIIDTPVAERYHDLVSGFAVPQADFLIVPAIPSYQTLVNINRWLKETVSAPRSANGLGVPYERIGVVLNRAEEDISCGEEEVKQELGSWQFLGSIPESKEWKRANNEHRLVALSNLHDLNEALVHILNQATGFVEPYLSPTAVEVAKPSRFGQLRSILARGK
jgi:cellulose biosynthesis protein BcsQ